MLLGWFSKWTTKGKRFPKVKGSFLKGQADSFKDGWRYIYEESLRSGLFFKIRVFVLPLYYVLDPKVIEHVLMKNYRNYAKGFAFKTIREMLGNGLLAVEHDKWKRDRSYLQPLFKKVNMNFLDQVQHVTLAQIDSLKAQYTGAPIEIDSQRFFFDLTFEVIQKTFMPENAVYKDKSQMFFDIEFLLTYITKKMQFPHMLIPKWVPTPYYRKIHAAKRRVDKVLYDGINHIREHPSDESIMDLMCQIPDFTNEEIRDHILTFLFAGHETSSLTLQYLFYVMTQYPEYAQKVISEFDQLDGKIVRNLNETPFTKAMVYEVLRLYSALVVIGRQCIQDDVVEGFKIPGGSLVQIPIYAVHRHPDLWESPNEFNPYRFYNVDEKTYRYKWIPFGDGPRICIGQQLALSEIAVVLSMMYKHFKITAGNSTLDFLTDGISLRTKSPLSFFVSPRMD